MLLVQSEDVSDPRLGMLLEMLRARCNDTRFPHDAGVNGESSIYSAAQAGFHAAREVVDEWLRMTAPCAQRPTNLDVHDESSCT